MTSGPTSAREATASSAREATAAATASKAALGRALRSERTMVGIRWAGVAFGIVQVMTYYGDYPPGVRSVALALVAGLAAGNVAIWLATRRVASLPAARRLAGMSLALDVAVVMGLIWVYTFDPEVAVWALVYILPLEGAIRFQRAGALLTMVVAALMYTAREIYGDLVYGNSLLLTSVSFRMGIGLLIAGVAGAMASSLVHDRQELERAKAALEDYAADLAATNADLQAANEVKDDFLTMTNHELRTPLTTILGYSSLLRRRWDSIPDGRRREFVAWIEDQGRRLQVLVEDLLTLSSAQAGGLEVSLEPVDISTAVDEAVRSSGMADVENACEPGLRVWADAGRLQQILSNYLSNAAKYGAPPVRVDARIEQHWVAISVCDAGPGVPESFVPRLFDKFTQASKGMSRTAEGTGLGLAIVRRLTEAQGGSAWYEPNQPRGARFSVRLPHAGE